MRTDFCLFSSQLDLQHANTEHQSSEAAGGSQVLILFLT